MNDPAAPAVAIVAEPIEARGGLSRLEAIKILHATWHGHFWDSAKLLAQAWAFYLTITAALVGFVLTRSLDSVVQRRLLGVGILISAIHLLGFTLWGRQLARLAATLEHLTRELNRAAFVEFGFDRVFRRWKTMQTIVILNSAAVILTLIAGMIASLLL